MRRACYAGTVAIDQKVRDMREGVYPYAWVRIPVQAAQPENRENGVLLQLYVQSARRERIEKQEGWLMAWYWWVAIVLFILWVIKTS